MTIILPMESVITQDGHDSWDYGNINASSLAVINPLEVYLVVEEELSDNEICTSIHFFFEVPDVIFS